ncbi:V-type ATP synthase subunit K [Bacteroidia bacterium]|nr:V-type ATP synthase subunit K [Bacteroidia bacterium]
MEPIVLAYIGIGLMVALTGIGSAIGLAACGCATVGAIKKNPAGFGNCMILSALPSTQGIYGFIGFYLMLPTLTTDMLGWLPAAAVFGTGLALGLVGIMSAIQQGRVCASGITAIGSGHNVFSNTLILAAFPELYAIIALLVVILVNGTL